MTLKEWILESKTNLFHTPENWNEIMDWIEAHAMEDRDHLLVAASMGWNLALDSVAEGIGKMEEEEKINYV